MTRFLRFVKSAHFFAFAFACVFGVFFATNSFATLFPTCSPSCGRNEYCGPSNECQNCSYVSNSYTAMCDYGDIQCRKGYTPYKVYDIMYACGGCPIIKEAKDNQANFSYNVGEGFNSCDQSGPGYSNGGTSFYFGTSNSAYCSGTITYTLDHSYIDSDYDICSTQSCYNRTITYTSAKAGYSVTNNGSANPTCAECGANQYSPNGDIVCHNVPDGAKPNSAKSGWECKAGYYKSGSECVLCPYYVNNNNQLVRGTSPVGSTSISNCYIDGSNLSPVTDVFGTYQDGGNCYHQNNSSLTYYMCMEPSAQSNDACVSGLQDFCNRYLNAGTYNGDHAKCANVLMGGLPPTAYTPLLDLINMSSSPLSHWPCSETQMQNNSSIYASSINPDAVTALQFYAGACNIIVIAK